MSSHLRIFRSIQAVPVGSGFTILAIADDGTAWAANTNSLLNTTDIEWHEVTPLPDQKNTPSLLSEPD